MSSIELDSQMFIERVGKLYTYLKNDNSVDAVYLIIGQDGDTTYSKSLALQTWLFDVVLRDTLMVFCKNSILFLTNPKKINFIKQADKEKFPEGVEVKYFERSAQDNDVSLMKEVSDEMSKLNSITRIGILGKDKSTGSFADNWRSLVSEKGWEKVDFSNSLSEILAIKDQSEIDKVRKASEMTSTLFLRFLRERIRDIVDKEMKVRHSKLTTVLSDSLNTPECCVDKADAPHTEFCYPPIFQSGSGRYALKYSTCSDDNLIQFDALVCMFGLRYKSYCSNIGRTFLIFPTSKMENAYEFLLQVHENAINSLRPGVEMNALYKLIMTFAHELNPDLSKYLTPNFGFLSGIEFKDTTMLINSKCTRVAKEGMVFQVHVGISDVPGLKEVKSNRGKDGKHSLYLADTVLVQDKDSPSILLTQAGKKLNAVSVRLVEEREHTVPDSARTGDDDEAIDSSSCSEDKSSASDDANYRHAARRLRRPNALLENKTRQEQSSEQKRLEHQKDLAKNLHEAAMCRLMKGRGKPSPDKIRKWNVSYKHASQFPNDPSIAEMKIFVDKRAETVIMPVYGYACPFHISTIKNVSLTVEGDYTYLRINFFHPGSAVVRTNEQQYSNNNAIFVKELTYRASNVKNPGISSAPSSNLHTAFRLIKDVQKVFREQEAEKRELEGVIKQDALVPSMNKNIPRLKDLCVRPSISQKRVTGSLEAHNNGVRYTPIRGDPIDILFSNVKHAFHQSCDGEMIILLHFHLKHPIIFGKRKQTDIQFYAEVGELATDLNKSKSRRDQDDIAAEQAERDYRQKLKMIFRTFIERLEANAPAHTISFETPFRDLGFNGTPYRSMVLLIPTSSCLVNLSEWPPFVITLDEVELVHFERVQFHLKNFDMVFVFKDYMRKVVMVNSIPMQQLDVVKDWLNSCDIKYTEGVQSLNWAKVMKAINDDIEGFFESGGWNFLEPESEEAESVNSLDENEDDLYEPSETSEAHSSSESEYLGSESDESSSESEREVSDEDGSSGKSWSELEEEARRADLEKDDYENGDVSSSRMKKSSRGIRSGGGLSSKNTSRKSFSKPHRKQH